MLANRNQIFLFSGARNVVLPVELGIFILPVCRAHQYCVHTEYGLRGPTTTPQNRQILVLVDFPYQILIRHVLRPHSGTQTEILIFERPESKLRVGV